MTFTFGENRAESREKVNAFYIGCHISFIAYSWSFLCHYLSFSVISLIITLCHFLSFLTIKSPCDLFLVLSIMFQSPVSFAIIHCVIFCHFLSLSAIFRHFSHKRVLKCESTQV